MNSDKPLKVALVHDFLMQQGGAEKILQVISELYPNASIYTLVADKKITDNLLPGKKIITSYIQSLPLAKKHYKAYLGLMPSAFERFDFSQYDLVISDSSAFAKNIITPPKTIHICYLHTPTRYLWGETDFYIKTAVSFFVRPFVYLIIDYLRKKDIEGSKRPDYIIANAKEIADRCKQYYQRSVDAVINPFADIEKFTLSKNKRHNYFLMANRLVPYKRNDIVIEAFNRLQLPLKIIGDGYGRTALEKLNTSPNTQFLGRVSDEELIKAYQECRAYIFPALEDFGITPLEAMACGTPVIAYGAGGVTESVIENETGIFFESQTPESVTGAIKQFKRESFNYEKIRHHALQFSKERFKNEMKAFIATATKKELK